MAVKDYHAKYKERLNSEDDTLSTEGFNALIFDAIRESNQVMTDRSEDDTFSDEGVNALIFDAIRESNQVMTDRKINMNERRNK